MIKLIGMKHNIFTIPFKSLLVICSLVLLSSCSKKLHFAASPVVPAATGTIKYKKDNNGNYAIDAKIYNLAEAKNLTPSKNTYVLWMEAEQNGVQNLGQINPSSSLFSSTLKASLEAVTPFKPRSFFITAEDNPTVTYPGQQVVLRTR